MHGRRSDGPWLDDAAGRLVRPYTVSNGRTRPTTALDLLSQVMATGATPLGYLGPEHAAGARAVRRTPSRSPRSPPICSCPRSVTKVLLSDLVDCGALTDERRPRSTTNPPTDPCWRQCSMDYDDSSDAPSSPPR